MPGLFGGAVGDEEFSAMGASTYKRDVHTTEEHDLGDLKFGLTHHGPTDPGGHTVIQEGSTIGVIYGVLSNVRDRELSVELVRDILDAPDEVLPTLTGPFAIICADTAANRLVVATDKAGTRSCYYTTEGTFAFGSEVTSLVPLLEEPSLDEQAVSDLLLMGHVWGEKTLVDGVKGLRPASYLTYDDGDVEVEQYWDISFGTRSDDKYVQDVVDAYESSVHSIADTVDTRLGLWLSGGLDSRLLAVSLRSRSNDFQTFTYNRPLEFGHRLFKDDIDVADQVADVLDVENSVLSTTATTLRERLPQIVEMTDGMAGWHTLSNLSAAFELPTDDVDVLFEGAAHVMLCGEHVWTHSLQNDVPAPTELRTMHERVDGDTVAEILAGDIDPEATFEAEVDHTDYETRSDRILGVSAMNYYPRKHYLTNKVSRAFVGTREPFADGRLLDLIAKMPMELRRETLPFTSGNVPLVPSRMKLELMRTMNKGGERLPYEATQLPPTSHYRAHNLAFFLRSAVERTFSERSLSDWYRKNEQFRTYVNDLLDSAAERPVFDEETVSRLRREHESGDADHIFAISGVTTVELFYRNAIDSV